MHSQKAFTLIETLAALAIIAIVLAMSLPALRHFFNRTDDDIVKLTLIEAIDLARQEAHARHVPVVLCKSNNQLSCSGNWADGLLIFMDVNGDGVVRDREQIIQVMQGKPRYGKIYWRSFPYYRDYLLFPPAGLMRYDNATFWYCHTDSASPVWAIVLSKTGKTRVDYPDADGNIKDGNGKTLSCM